MSEASEKRIIDRTAEPLTVESLTRKLRDCGLEEGQTVLVHMAMMANANGCATKRSTPPQRFWRTRRGIRQNTRRRCAANR